LQECFIECLLLGPGRITFWSLGGPFLRRLGSSNGLFDLTTAANIESVADRGTTGRVVSSTDWGNLLIWSSKTGRVELEVTRKDESNCHDGSINQLVAGEGELITIGRK
jgi:hypothetical protein